MALDFGTTVAVGTVGAAGELAADAAITKMTGGYSVEQLRAGIPAAAGGVAGLAIAMLATPLAGALAASWAPRRPVKGALVAMGVNITLSIVGALLVASAVSSSIPEEVL